MTLARIGVSRKFEITKPVPHTNNYRKTTHTAWDNIPMAFVAPSLSTIPRTRTKMRTMKKSS